MFELEDYGVSPVNSYCHSLISDTFEDFCEDLLSENTEERMITRYMNLTENQRSKVYTNGPFPSCWPHVTNVYYMTEHGIANWGNKSGLIAAFQLLSHVPGFQNLIMTHNSDGCDAECIICEWQYLQFDGTDIQCFGEILEDYQRHDLAQSVKTVVEYVLSLCNFVNCRFSMSNGYDFMSDIFGFEVQSELTCLRCGGVSILPENHYRSFSLIEKGNHDHLQQHIDDRFSSKLTTETNCNYCGWDGLLKTHYFTRTPHVLMIMDTNEVLKNAEQPVHICKRLNLGKHAALNNSEYGVYELCGFISQDLNDYDSKDAHLACLKEYGSERFWNTLRNEEVYPGMLDPTMSRPRVMMYRRVLHCQNDEIAPNTPARFKYAQNEFNFM